MQNSMNSIENEIKAHEQKFWDAMVKRDYNTIEGLTDFPCVVAGAQGSHAFNKEEFKKLFQSDDGQIKKYKFDEDSIDVRQLSPETAIIAYRVNCTFQQKGEDKTIDAVDTSIWVKRDGKWACAMHTETELPKGLT